MAVICTLPGRERRIRDAENGLCWRSTAVNAYNDDGRRVGHLTDRRERSRERRRESLSSPRGERHRDITHRSAVAGCAVTRARAAARRDAPFWPNFQRATPYKTVTGARYQQVMPKEKDTPSSGIVERLPWALSTTTLI